MKTTFKSSTMRYRPGDGRSTNSTAAETNVRNVARALSRAVVRSSGNTASKPALMAGGDDSPTAQRHTPPAPAALPRASGAGRGERQAPLGGRPRLGRDGQHDHDRKRDQADACEHG